MLAQHAFLMRSARGSARRVIALGAERYERPLFVIEQQAVVGRIADIAG